MVKIPTSDGDKVPHHVVQAQIAQAVRAALGCGVEVHGVDLEGERRERAEALDERNRAMGEIVRLRSLLDAAKAG